MKVASKVCDVLQSYVRYLFKLVNDAPFSMAVVKSVVLFVDNHSLKQPLSVQHICG